MRLEMVSGEAPTARSMAERLSQEDRRWMMSLYERIFLA